MNNKFASEDLYRFVKDQLRFNEKDANNIVADVKTEIKKGTKDFVPAICKKYKLRRATLSLFVPEQFLSREDIVRRNEFALRFKKQLSRGKGYIKGFVPKSFWMLVEDVTVNFRDGFIIPKGSLLSIGPCIYFRTGDCTNPVTCLSTISWCIDFKDNGYFASGQDESFVELTESEYLREVQREEYLDALHRGKY